MSENYEEYYMDVQRINTNGAAIPTIIQKAKLINGNKHKYVNKDGFVKAFNLDVNSANRLMHQIAKLYFDYEYPVMSAKDEFRTDYLEKKAMKLGYRKNDLKDIPKTYDKISGKLKVGIADEFFEELLSYRINHEDDPGFNFQDLISTKHNFLEQVFNYQRRRIPKQIPKNNADFESFKARLADDGASLTQADSVAWVSYQNFLEQQEIIDELQTSLHKLYDSMVVRKNEDFLPPMEFTYYYDVPRQQTEFLIDHNGDKYQEFLKWSQNHQPDKDNLQDF